MPDILIRGMEEPPRCSACRMLDGDADDGFCHAANKWLEDEWFYWFQYPDGDIATDKPLNCPLVPLPEGHGRLIDIEDVKSEKFHIEGRAEMYSAYNIGWNDALDAVCMNAPPIVPAEEGTDE